MSSIKLKYIFFPYKLCVFLLIFIFSHSTANVFSQEKSKKKRPEFEVQLKLATIYDDNILKYSEKYLERFMNGEDEGRFHIETYDDLIFYTSIQLTGTFRIFGDLKSKINGEYSRRTYTVNGIKDWNYFTVGFRQYLPGRTSFKLLYSFIPDFYVRHFRDELWIEYFGYNPLSFQPYAFSKDNFGFYIQKYFFKSTRIKLSLYYSKYFHNEYFTEYDSKNMSYGIQLYQPLHKKIRLELGYQYVTSDAKGYDEAIETPETTNGPDATYEEDRFTLGIVWRLPRIKKLKHELNVKCLFYKRYYLSEHPWQIDRLHAGRVDDILRVYMNYKIRFNKSWQLTAYYNWLGRNSGTTAELNNTYVSNEKDYRQNIFGLEINYTLKF